MDFEVDFGADVKSATPFELAADGAIRELLENHPGDLDPEEFDAQRRFYKPGRDYLLTPDKSRGTPPVYNLLLKDDNGRPFPVGKLDVRQRFNNIVEADKAVRLVKERIAIFEDEFYRQRGGARGGGAELRAAWEIFLDRSLSELEPVVDGTVVDLNALFGLFAPGN